MPFLNLLQPSANLGVAWIGPNHGFGSANDLAEFTEELLNLQQKTGGRAARQSLSQSRDRT